MAWTIEEAIKRAGLTPPIDDAIRARLQSSMDMTVTLLTRYLNRKFLYAKESETFNRPIGYGLSLSRYPVVKIDKVEVNGIEALAAAYDVHPQIGIVRSYAFNRAISVTVATEAGYQPDGLPHDLEWCMWHLWDRIEAEKAGEAPSAPVGTETERSITLFDIGSVSYDTRNPVGEGRSPLDVFTPGSRFKDIMDAYTRPIGAI